jgi:hypothetical protein
MMSAGKLEPVLNSSVKLIVLRKETRVFSQFQSSIQEKQQEAKVWQIDGHPQGVCQRYCTRAICKLLTLRALLIEQSYCFEEN